MLNNLADLQKEIAGGNNSFQKTNLEKILNDLFDGVYIVNKRRQIIFWNRGAEKITGYSSREVIGKRCSDNILNHIDENGNLLCGTARCPLAITLGKGKNVQAKVYPLHKTKRRFPVKTHVSPLKNYQGRIIAAIEIFRDITKEEQYRILQEKFDRLIQRYVSKSTYRDVIRQAKGFGIRSSKQDLTISFIDIVGFTSYAERHSEKEVVEMLNAIFGICEVITKESFGDIDKFIGDSAMSVFLDANDAVKAGEKILEKIKELNRQRIKQGKEEIKIRIGINSGRVIRGDIGGKERKDLTVVGDAVNTASRIQGGAEPNRVFIAESTYSRLKKPQRFKFHGQIIAKGKKKPVLVFSSAR